MNYSIDPVSADCYEGTTCLINKFGIRDEKKLSQIETIISTARCNELELNPIKGDFGFDHYKAIHQYIFGDIYDWAGKVRTVSMSKKGTKFTEPDAIENLAKMIFANLQKENCYLGYDFERFIGSVVDLYCNTNILHPFREGNGRTQRVFLTQLIRYCGYDINFSNIDTDELMIATIQSANGVNDYLYSILKESIR